MRFPARNFFINFFVAYIMPENILREFLIE